MSIFLLWQMTASCLLVWAQDGRDADETTEADRELLYLTEQGDYVPSEWQNPRAQEEQASKASQLLNTSLRLQEINDLDDFGYTHATRLHLVIEGEKWRWIVDNSSHLYTERVGGRGAEGERNVTWGEYSEVLLTLEVKLESGVTPRLHVGVIRRSDRSGATLGAQETQQAFHQIFPLRDFNYETNGDDTETTHYAVLGLGASGLQELSKKLSWYNALDLVILPTDSQGSGLRWDSALILKISPGKETFQVALGTRGEQYFSGERDSALFLEGQWNLALGKKRTLFFRPLVGLSYFLEQSRFRSFGKDGRDLNWTIALTLVKKF